MNPCNSTIVSPLELPPLRWPGDPPPTPPAAKPEPGEGEAEGEAEAAPEEGAEGADGAEGAEEEEDDTPKEGEVCGLDVMSVQVAVNARDRAFDELRCSVKDHLASHTRSMRRRLQDEVLHKERWYQLVERTESAHS